MSHRGDIGTKGAAAEIVELGSGGFVGETPHVLQNRRQRFLSVGLADRAEPHRGRDEIGEQAQDEGLQRAAEVKSVARGSDADRDRISDRLVRRSQANGRARGNPRRRASRRQRPRLAL